MDKENSTSSELNVMRTPPALVPAKSARKSSVKRVRFSMDEQRCDFDSSQTLGLNGDLVPAGTMVPEHRPSVPNSVRKSVDAISFPTQIDLLADAPLTSPDSHSRQSTGSVGDPLQSALGGGQFESVWDTPTSGALEVFFGRPSPARVRQSITDRKSLLRTDFEQNLFQFKVNDEGREPVDAPTEVRDEVVGSPISVPVCTDDPMLLSGTSLRTPQFPSSSRRRRRLSSLDDIQSELLSSSPPNRKLTEVDGMEKVTNPEEFFTLIDSLISAPAKGSPGLCAPPISLPTPLHPITLNILAQLFKSMELTLDSAIAHVREVVVSQSAEVEAMKNNPTPWADCVAKFTEDPKTAKVELLHTVEAAQEMAADDAKKLRVSIASNLVANLATSTYAKFEQFSNNLHAYRAKADALLAEASQLECTVAEQAEEQEVEFRKKFHETEAGEFQRKQTFQELQLAQVDRLIEARVAEIKECVQEVADLEESCKQRQKTFQEEYAKVRDFYFNHGWHVAHETREFVLVFSVCFLFLFQRAADNPMWIRLEQIFPVRFDKHPPAHLAAQVDWNEDLVLQDVLRQSGLRMGEPFFLDPQIFCQTINAATTRIAQWVDLRQRLSLDDSRSRIKINASNQIEAILIGANDTCGIELPLMVKLLWFDPVMTKDETNFNNFSLIISDYAQSVFPALKREVEQALAVLPQARGVDQVGKILHTIRSTLLAHPALGA